MLGVPARNEPHIPIELSADLEWAEKKVDNFLDLNAEAVLDPTINLENTQLEVVSEPTSTTNFDQKIIPKNIFITGVTGFVGIPLLHELLNQTQATIYYLVRASGANEAQNKLDNQIKKSINFH